MPEPEAEILEVRPVNVVLDHIGIMLRALPQSIRGDDAAVVGALLLAASMKYLRATGKAFDIGCAQAMAVAALEVFSSCSQSYVPSPEPSTGAPATDETR